MKKHLFIASLSLSILNLSVLSPSVEAESRKFRIGVSCPLSGVLAEYGTAIQNGIALAQENEPKKFENIEIVFEDSKWDPKTAVQVFHTLQDIRKVDVIYNWGNPTSDAVAPLADRGRMPTIAMSSDPKIAAGRKYVVRSINSADELGRLLASYLLAKGYRSIGVQVAENTYVQGLYDGLAAEFSSQGKTAVLGRFSIDDQNFASVVTRLKEKQLDALGVFLISGQVSSFYRQLAVQQLNVPTFGADFLDSQNEIRAAGPMVEGAVFPTFDVIDSFRSQYVKKFNNDVQIPFAANARDVVLLLAELFGDGDTTVPSPEEIIQKIEGTKNFKGANGSFSVKSDDSYGPSFRYPLIVKKVVDGRPVRVN